MALQEIFPDPVTVFSARLPDEPPCLLTDIAVIPGAFVVIDNENKNAKRFNFQMTLIDLVKLEDPCGVTKLSLSSHVAVTQPQQHVITFISVETGGKMSISSSRHTNRKYQSISCLDEMRLVAGCCELGHGSVDILTYEGDVLCSIERNESKSRIFRTPASLTCFAGRYVLVSDSGRRELVCVTTKGELKFVHDPHGTPSGVGVTNTGDVYVCIYDKGVVQKIDVNMGTTCDDCLPEVETRFPLATCLPKDRVLVITEEMPSDRVLVVNLDAYEKTFKHGPTLKLSNIHLTIDSSYTEERNTVNQVNSTSGCVNTDEDCTGK
ncbi:uncharacterized protein LOC110458592 [Mizuhopecten yessoensis]|uniref:Uncharacterized protein n=1 Tax=Mizuhopecten yessoensis TaxID=6573 RepID=A0A210Q6C4_MIZYE|nr:uncharacterized protein LOC110458592 [Mizuhopecten yessoensis]OWF44287.1 hypothetical protein KP79_PYT15820 [Mizuhopecten yessoensis]